MTPTGIRAFSPDEVRLIRSRAAEGLSAKTQALAYGVSTETIRKIIRRDTYAEIADMRQRGSAPRTEGGTSGPPSGPQDDLEVPPIPPGLTRLAVESLRVPPSEGTLMKEINEGKDETS
jgi:hypothetical protein